MIGTKLAHYEITSHIGSGGMGDVYQATDRKLGRNVAIKILPEAFARDADRVARFEREARVLASLNHPNIAAIYGLEDAGERKFLVMELVPGETLAGRIARGALPIDDALGLARQIAEALEAAHEKSVMHRDLKPANIKVTASGQVKVLDFGLAKAFAGEADVNLSNSPTLSLAATNAGMILGTAAYMSPEQARGNDVDHRTDIFAFGCVLYEMLTGRPAFPGDTVSDIWAGVLKVEPDWSRLPAHTPAAVRRLLRRCLQKDRNWRLHTAADVRIEIADSRAEPDQNEQAAGFTLQGRDRRRERTAWIATLGLVFAAAVTLAVPYFRAPAEAPEMRLDIVTPATPDPFSFAISPDGRRLVFAASGDGAPRLWLRPLDAVTAQPLAGTEGARYPFWSPDSRSVGFFAGGKLMRTEIGGGLPRPLADAAPGFGGTWSPDDVILFTPVRTSPLLRVPASGGDAVALTKLAAPRQTSHRFPRFLPGGRQFLLYIEGTADRGIYLGSLDASEPKRLTSADSAGAYLPPGWLLYIRQGTLVAQRFDLARGELGGDPVTVADPVGFNGNDNAAAFSVSAAGLVTYRTTGSARSQLTWFDRSGRVLGTFGAPDQNNLYHPELSPNGRLVAVNRTLQGNQDVWLMDAVGPARFTGDASLEQYPVWSPDGTWIAFTSNRKGVHDLYKKPSRGAGSEELLWESPQGKNLDDWSRDGRFLLFNSEDPKSGRDLWLLPLDRGGKPGKAAEFRKTTDQEHRGQFSPDGRWVAYVSDQSGQAEIHVAPFPPGPGGELQVSTAGGFQPRWRHDGRELYYIAPDGKLMAVAITVRGAALERAAPVPLFPTRIAVGGNPIYTRPQYDVASDGRLLINVTTEDASTGPIILLQNWKPPAK